LAADWAEPLTELLCQSHLKVRAALMAVFVALLPNDTVALIKRVLDHRVAHLHDAVDAVSSDLLLHCANEHPAVLFPMLADVLLDSTTRYPALQILRQLLLGMSEAQGSRNGSDEFSSVAEPPLLALILLLQQKGDSDPLRHTAIVCLMMILPHVADRLHELASTLLHLIPALLTPSDPPLSRAPTTASSDPMPESRHSSPATLAAAQSRALGVSSSPTPSAQSAAASSAPAAVDLGVMIDRYLQMVYLLFPSRTLGFLREYAKRRPDFLSAVASHVERLPFHVGLLKDESDARVWKSMDVEAVLAACLDSHRVRQYSYPRGGDARLQGDESDADRSSSAEADRTAHCVAQPVVVLSLEQVRQFRTKRLSSRDTVTAGLPTVSALQLAVVECGSKPIPQARVRGALCCNVLYWAAPRWAVLQRAVLRCNTIGCFATRCTALQQAISSVSTEQIADLSPRDRSTEEARL
jgi:hypothetical protein